MTLGLSLNMNYRLELTTEQKQEQRLALRNEIFAREMGLLNALYNEHYNPQGSCPKCFHELTAAEILIGFNRDPKDFTTACPKCRTRFTPSVICFSAGAKIEMPFYCDIQTLDQLRDKANWKPEDIARAEPAVFRSAIIHHGSLKAAFAKLGIGYKLNEVSGWQSKVLPFLGKIADTTIARAANVKCREVAKLRFKYRVDAYRREELEELIEKIYG